jgi:hypothetical protein
MATILVVRQTFWELEDEISDNFEVGRNARSFSDFGVRYDNVLADLSEASDKFDDVCCKATAETCSSVGNSTDLLDNWADLDTDPESDESEPCCATPPPEEQLGLLEEQLAQQAMMPVQFVMVPVAQTNQSRIAPPPGKLSAPPPGNLSAPPPGNFSLRPVMVQKKPPRTTVVLRNVPSHFSKAELLNILDDAGFSERYDFVYLPTNFRSMTAFGYAIVNFSDPADAQAALDQFSGTSLDGQDIITEWSKSQQGYDDLVCRYRNSPVMHSSVPDQHKPILFANGRLQSFPSPTEPLQPPRMLTRTEA